jgi:hypothetical protein
MQDQRLSIVFCIPDKRVRWISSTTSSWQYIASKCAPFGRLRITRKPSHDHKMMTMPFGLLVIFLGIVVGAISARFHIA